MSFGFGVGDFIAVGGLCWKVYKKCKDSSGNYAELSGEVSALYTVIKETEELLSQQGLTQEQQAKLDTCRQGCEAVLKNLDGLLIKYESLGTKSQRTFDRIGLGNEDINGIRLRLISNVSMLDAFNNTCVECPSLRSISSIIDFSQLFACKTRKEVEPIDFRNPCWETRRLYCLYQNVRHRCSK